MIRQNISRNIPVAPGLCRICEAPACKKRTTPPALFEKISDGIFFPDTAGKILPGRGIFRGTATEP
ncbi:MAG: hypothetical protein PVJ84_10365 [Desulfobacteraceae bacterium]|jgi:hypothetical protein